MLNKLLILSLLLGSLLAGGAAAQSTGKNPVIVIPGISGSTLVNPKTGKTVWFSVRRDKDDDLRLPMTSAVLSRNRDALVATDIIREVKLPVLPDIEVYQSLIDALIERGYTEAKWDKPKATDVFYVFPYDWRRDNVETAHLLMQRMASVKRTLKRPGLKFDIISHSMGGLIARYAAMYGMSPLPAVRPVPNWSGAAHMNKLMMFGTPNEGSFSSLEVLFDGYPIVANRRLPLIDDVRAEDVMSIPSIYQLMPHRPTARFLDEALNPMDIDIYNVDTWIKYGWGPIADPKFLSKLRDAGRLALHNKDIKPQKLKADSSREDRLISQLTFAQVKAFVTSALDRARLLHQALDVPVKSPPIQLYAYGGNCEPTIDGLILVHDDSKDRWNTILEARDFKTSSGTEIKKAAVRSALYTEGDGRVTKRSLLAERSLGSHEGTGTDGGTNGGTNGGLIPLKSSFLACGSHTKLFLEKPIQDSFFSALIVQGNQQP